MRFALQCLAAASAGYAVVALVASATSRGGDAMNSNAGNSARPSLEKSIAGDSTSNIPAVMTARKDALALLAEAKELKDALSVAAKSIEGIDALTKASFAELLAQGEMPDLLDFRGDPYEELIRAAFIEKWAEVEPDSAMTQIFDLAAKLHAKSNDGMAGRLLEIAGGTRPGEFLREAFRRGDPRRSVLEPAFTSLATRDLVAARRFLAEVPAADRESIEEAIGAGMAVSDPLGAMESARKFRSGKIFIAALAGAERVGPGLVRKVVGAAGDSFGGLGGQADLAGLALRYPAALEGLELPGKLYPPSSAPPPGFLWADAKIALRKLPPEKRAAMLQAPEKIPFAIRDDLVSGLVELWADAEPKAALPWALAESAKMDGSEHQWHWAYTAFFEWHRQDPAAALVAWQALPDGPAKEGVGSSMVRYATDLRHAEVARSYFQITPAYRYHVEEESLVREMVKKNPVEAGEWLLAMPSDWRWDWQLVNVAEALERQQPGALADWVETLPTQAAQERLIPVAAKFFARDDPETAAEWIELLEGPQAQSAAEEVFLTIHKYDPIGGTKWLRSLTNVEPAWRERLLRLTR